ncbi:MAG: putative outer membrane protein [Rhodobacteraceae bacterium HLUCCA08]|nr:MAG: putative outer membrane protein [Rhodobacteraceae bacterium HLUCCA08]
MSEKEPVERMRFGGKMPGVVRVGPIAGLGGSGGAVFLAGDGRGRLTRKRKTEMTTWIKGAALCAVMAAGACDELTADQNTIVGVAGGAAAGLIAADVLRADDDWRLIAALGGAAAGTLVAQNNAAGTCAYARGDGTYYTAACP